MLYHERSEDYRPLFWLQGRPIYVNTLVVILHILAFAATALAISMSSFPTVEGALSLGTYQVLHFGQIWRLVTYVVFPPQAAIGFIFAMLFLFYFGKQLEEFVGRSTYAKIYAALVLVPALLACALELAGVAVGGYLGGYGTVLGVFVAFVTIYPRMELNFWFVSLAAMHWALILLGVFSLLDIASHDWISLGALWCDAAIGYLGMRLIGAGYGMTWLTDWFDEVRSRRLARQHNLRVLKDTKATESIDEILEKISKQGVGSLNSRERSALERARTNLLKRDQP